MKQLGGPQSREANTFKDALWILGFLLVSALVIAHIGAGITIGILYALDGGIGVGAMVSALYFFGIPIAILLIIFGYAIFDGIVKGMLGYVGAGMGVNKPSYQDNRQVNTLVMSDQEKIRELQETIQRLRQQEVYEGEKEAWRKRWTEK